MLEPVPCLFCGKQAADDGGALCNRCLRKSNRPDISPAYIAWCLGLGLVAGLTLALLLGK